MAVFFRAYAAREVRDYESALRDYREAADLARPLGDRWLLSLTLSHMGLVSYYLGDYAAARSLIEYRRATGREFGFAGHQTLATFWLGRVALAEQDLAQAVELFKEALLLSRRFGFAGSIPDALSYLCEIALAKGAAETAARLLAACRAHDRDAQDPDVDYNGITLKLQAQLGEAVFNVAWAAGSVLGLDQAIEEALKV
jgi:hypothetical protein